MLVLSTSRSDAQAASTTVPAWVTGSTCYEVFVRSFYDSNGDGIGDLNGLIQKLDYINDGNAKSKRDLGATCIWLMPIAESPSYHGYDVSDYYKVERDYGTNADFKRLVSEAHKRGIKVLVDMVINHMSSEHPFFQAALTEPSSPYREYFRFSDTVGAPNRWGGNNWHKSPRRNEFYYGFFYKGMPDLNYEKPAAPQEMKKVATFWLKEMGVDGFRLDAVKYLVERGTQVEDTPETHRVLREYAAHVKKMKPQAYTIGEVFDSTGALLPYYPDQLDGYFAFEIADSILSGVRRGDARGILVPALRLQSALPARRYSPFLRNHDQIRTLTDLGGDIGKAKLAAALLLTLPGFPFVYYGEELGMMGNKPDERLRTPMAWSKSAPHAGFSTGKPWEAMQPDSLSANVEALSADRNSLLNLYRTFIHLRRENAALASGILEPVSTVNQSVVAYLRQTPTKSVLIVANLSQTSVSDATLSLPTNSLRNGYYRARLLWGSGAPSELTIASDQKRSQYTPFSALAPMSAYVVEFIRRP